MQAEVKEISLQRDRFRESCQIAVSDVTKLQNKLKANNEELKVLMVCNFICCIVKGRIEGQNCAFASDTAHFCDRKCAVSTKRPLLIKAIINSHSIIWLHNVNHGHNTNTYIQCIL